MIANGETHGEPLSPPRRLFRAARTSGAVAERDGFPSYGSTRGDIRPGYDSRRTLIRNRERFGNSISFQRRSIAPPSAFPIRPLPLQTADHTSRWLLMRKALAARRPAISSLGARLAYGLGGCARLTAFSRLFAAPQPG